MLSRTGPSSLSFPTSSAIDNAVSVSTPTRRSTRLLPNTPPSLLKSSLISPHSRATSLHYAPINEDDGPEVEDDDDVFLPSARADDDWVDVGRLSDREDVDDNIGVSAAPKRRSALSRDNSVDEDESGQKVKSFPRGAGGQGGRFSEAQLKEVEKHAAIFKAAIAGLAHSWDCYPSTLYRIAGVAGTLTKRRRPNAWNSFQHQQKLAKRNPSGLGAMVCLTLGNFIV